MIEKLDVYKRLKTLNILGEERRLEWADAITRIRTQRELLDLAYRVDRQRLLVSAPGKPANVDFFASAMRVQLALLHEEDLLRFLADLRDSGNAYYAVRQMLADAHRPAGRPASTIAPRLRGECDHRPHHHHRPGGQGMKRALRSSSCLLVGIDPARRRSSAACSSRPSSARRSTRAAGRACPTGRRSADVVSPTTRLDGYVKRSRRALDGLRQRRSDARGHARGAAWCDPRATRRPRRRRPPAKAARGSSLRPGEVLDRGTGEVRDVLGEGGRVQRSAPARQ